MATCQVTCVTITTNNRTSAPMPNNGMSLFENTDACMVIDCLYTQLLWNIAMIPKGMHGRHK